MWGEFSDKISKNNITSQFIAKIKFKFEIFELQKHSVFLSKQITATVWTHWDVPRVLNANNHAVPSASQSQKPDSYAQPQLVHKLSYVW